MDNGNFYLELLNKQVNEMKRIIEQKDNFTYNTYNCILAGIIIRMDCLLEQCLMGFHSDDFEEVLKTIYQSRQLLVHYSDYQTFNDVERISKQIIKEFTKVYPSEKEFFNKILAYQTKSEHNVVIAKSKNVIYDEFTNCYVFRNDQVEISVSSDKVVRIQDLKRRRDVAYIINCDTNMNYFAIDDKGEETLYQELSGYKQLQSFFNQQFSVLAMDYQGHKELISEVLETFYGKKNYLGVFTQEVASSSKKRPLYLESSKVLNNFFMDNIVFYQFLEAREYSNKGIPLDDCYNYKEIKEKAENDLKKKMNKRDYFFIVKSIAIFNDLSEMLVKNQHLSDHQKERLKLTLLINWADRTFRNLSDEFVQANEMFKKLHIKLITYRNFFAHNILQIKTCTGKKLLEDFYEVAKGYVSVLNGLNIKNIENLESKQMLDFVSIERNSQYFYSSKYEQYIQIDPSTYIGNKLFYSTRGSKYKKIIGLVGIDKACLLRGVYYEKQDDQFVAKTYKTNSGKKKNLLVTKLNYSKGREETLDINCDDLLTVYAAYRGKLANYDSKELYGVNHRRYLYFPPSERNNYQAHVSDLEEIIFDFYKQRYLPYELVQNTHLFLKDYKDKKIFTLVDDNGEEIAQVIDASILNEYNLEVDDKGFFTINETIFDFSKRRK